jgi:hypothetical protein
MHASKRCRLGRVELPGFPYPLSDSISIGYFVYFNPATLALPLAALTTAEFAVI